MLFSKNTIALALVPLALLTVLPQVAHASPAPALEARGDLHPALRRNWAGPEGLPKRGKSAEHGHAKETKKKPSKDGKKKATRDLAEDYDLAKREGKKGKHGEKKGKSEKHAREYELEVRDGKNGTHKDGKGHKGQKKETEHKNGTEHKSHKNGKD